MCLFIFTIKAIIYSYEQLVPQNFYLFACCHFYFRLSFVYLFSSLYFHFHPHFSTSCQREGGLAVIVEYEDPYGEARVLQSFCCVVWSVLRIRSILDIPEWTQKKHTSLVVLPDHIFTFSQ
jgi:hypothetical protein